MALGMEGEVEMSAVAGAGASTVVLLSVTMVVTEAGELATGSSIWDRHHRHCSFD